MYCSENLWCLVNSWFNEYLVFEIVCYCWIGWTCWELLAYFVTLWLWKFEQSRVFRNCMYVTVFRHLLHSCFSSLGCCSLFSISFAIQINFTYNVDDLTKVSWFVWFRLTAEYAILFAHFSWLNKYGKTPFFVLYGLSKSSCCDFYTKHK